MTSRGARLPLGADELFPATETNHNGTAPATGGHVGSTGPGVKVAWDIILPGHPLKVDPPMLFVIEVVGIFEQHAPRAADFG